MDIKLWINPSTKRTLVMEGNVQLPFMPEEMIFPFWSPSKPTMPPGLSSKLWNICLLLVMYRKHPESRYHGWCFKSNAKDICNIYYFILRYPYLSGSFWDSLPRVLNKLGLLCRISIHEWMIRIRMRFCFSLMFRNGSTFRPNIILFPRRNKMWLKSIWLVIFFRIRFVIRIITNTSCLISANIINHGSHQASIQASSKKFLERFIIFLYDISITCRDFRKNFIFRFETLALRRKVVVFQNKIFFT